MLINDDGLELRVEATLPETPLGDEALGLVKSKVLRGFSVEFIPKDSRVEKQNEKRVNIIEKAELRNIGLVDRPAYPAAKVNPRHKEDNSMENNMDDAKIKELIEERFDQLLASQKPKDGELFGESLEQLRASLSELVTTATSEIVESRVQEQIEDVLKQRDEAKADAEKAEAERIQAEEDAEKEREEIEAAAERRAALIVETRSLVAEDFDSKGKSVKEILIAAAGDEVEDAENRSEDYLQAKVEEILKRRESARATDGETGKNNEASTVIGRSFDLNKMVLAEREKKFRNAYQSSTV